MTREPCFECCGRGWCMVGVNVGYGPVWVPVSCPRCDGELVES